MADDEDICSPECHWADNKDKSEKSRALLRHLRESGVSGICKLCGQHEMAYVSPVESDDPGITPLMNAYVLICRNCGDMRLISTVIANELKNEKKQS